MPSKKEDKKQPAMIDLTLLVKGLIKKPIPSTKEDVKPEIPISNNPISEKKESLTVGINQPCELVIPKKPLSPKIVPVQVLQVQPKPTFDPYHIPDRTPRKRQDESFKIVDQFWLPSFDGNGLIVMLYTAYGKTDIALYLAQKAKDIAKAFELMIETIKNAIKCGKTTVVLVPLKALAEDHFPKFNKHFNTVMSTSDHESEEEKKRIFDPDIEVIIMTYEKYSKYVKIPSLREKFFVNIRIGALVIDEVHLIVDAERGANLEAFCILLTMYHQPDVKLLMLSATIGNPQEIADNYGLKLVQCEDPSERPVPLQIHTQVMRKLYGKQKEEMAKQNVVNLINEYLRIYGKDHLPNFIFFCTTRTLTNKLSTYFNTVFANIGLKSMIHNAGLNYEDRHKTEVDFRNQNVKVVFSSTTLSAGVDMPCDVVVLLGETFWNWLRSEERLIDPNQIKQICGRAGRGHGTLNEGHAYLYYQVQNRSYMEYYIYHQLDVISRVLPIDIVGRLGNLKSLPLDFSGVVPNKLPTVILGWIVSGITQISELKRLYQQLLRPTVWDMFDTTYKWLQDNEFIDQNGFHTDLGFKTTLYGIEPSTALHFIKLKGLLDNVNEITYPQLFALLIACDQYCSQIAIRDDSDDDATALANSNRFIHLNELENIMKNNEYFQEQVHTFIDQIRKGFAMTYNDHLGSEYKLPSVTMSNNDINTLKRSAQMLIHSGHQIIEKTWKWHQKLNLLNKGLNMEYPIFDTDILELMQVKGLSIKKTVTLIAIGARNLPQLITLDPKMVETKSRELMNEDKTKYYTISAKIFLEFKQRAKEILNGNPNDENEPNEINESND